MLGQFSIDVQRLRGQLESTSVNNIAFSSGRNTHISDIETLRCPIQSAQRALQTDFEEMLQRDFELEVLSSQIAGEISELRMDANALASELSLNNVPDREAEVLCSRRVAEAIRVKMPRSRGPPRGHVGGRNIGYRAMHQPQCRHDAMNEPQALSGLFGMQKRLTTVECAIFNI